MIAPDPLKAAASTITISPGLMVVAQAVAEHNASATKARTATKVVAGDFPPVLVVVLRVDNPSGFVPFWFFWMKASALSLLVMVTPPPAGANL
jgi:hypothetical protein